MAVSNKYVERRLNVIIQYTGKFFFFFLHKKKPEIENRVEVIFLKYFFTSLGMQCQMNEIIRSRRPRADSLPILLGYSQNPALRAAPAAWAVPRNRAWAGVCHRELADGLMQVPVEQQRLW